ncbi:MAG: cytidylate kinase-like family protein [Bacteroides sp.]|nr:cytidylate kinase-like family protein [Bacteroides sp.]MCM1379341.1 cytidylate kinase-like family protein [Bacteroides sp.]MCM1445201.1 cytidylate kinase-like family protein [Prevotella sp.]
MDNYVITIGRAMGSGGRELGRRLAEILGIEFYDKKLLADAARKSGLIPEMMERDDERTPSVLSGAFGVGFGSAFASGLYVSDDAVYRAQSDVIRDLGASKSCVIVGRTADYVLRDHPRCINIFVHAPEEECIKRLLRRGDKATESEARSMIRKINKIRAGYYNFYTDKTWGAASSYDLTVDSSLLPMPELAQYVADYVRLRLK